jgi:hypothetical protein
LKHPTFTATIKTGIDLDVEVDVDIETNRIIGVYVDGDELSVEVREWMIRQLGGETKILSKYEIERREVS